MTTHIQFREDLIDDILILFDCLTRAQATTLLRVAIALSEEGEASEHTCSMPLLPTAGVATHRPDWECGECGRRYAMIHGASGGAWWAEVKGAWRE